jgi:ATP-dependent Clp protease adapter protein ClpS/FMN phosphatase YigB (HAD superfamily)
MMQPHTLLLDVDGVIIRNQPLLRYIGNKCVNFVRRTSQYPLTYSKAKQINEVYYKNYGHTLRGLHKTLNNNTEFSFVSSQNNGNGNGKTASTDDFIEKLYKESSKDFDDIVYDADSISKLHDHLNTTEFFDNSERIAQLCLLCASKNIKVMMFSNAPLHWCLPIASKLAKIYGEPLIHDILSPGSSLFRPFLHKPDKQLYMNVESYISSNTSPTSKLLYVDDSLINLMPVLHNLTWEPILFKPQLDEDIENDENMRIEKKTCCHLMHSFTWLERYIDHIDHETHVTKFSVILRGGPFVKLNTVQKLLLECIPGLTDTDALHIAKLAHTNGYALITTCDQATAFTYCQSLIENGLYATIE